jgi:hypothetical protein
MKYLCPTSLFYGIDKAQTRTSYVEDQEADVNKDMRRVLKKIVVK